MTDPRVREERYGELRVEIHPTIESLAAAAARTTAETLRAAIAKRGRARAILATGNSQLAFFRALRSVDGVDWGQVEVLHMDEYLGIDDDHPASFRRFLRREVIEPLGVGRFHGIDGDSARAQETIEQYRGLLQSAPVDLCCMGIGENGHLAFNDPPGVDFEDPEPLKVVTLDEVSRRQQVGEGHFPDLESVPTHAITLTIPALLSAARVVVVAPESRKSTAVRNALEGPVDPACPASVLRRANHATLYLDGASASRLGSR